MGHGQLDRPVVVTLAAMRPSWIEVDLDAIEANVRAIRAAIAPADVCAVVKADGYGHGDIAAAHAAMAGGATWLAVALVAEGVRLREGGVDLPILVLSEPLKEEIDALVEWSLTPTVYRSDFIDAVAEVAEREDATPYPVHLKVDTGMHRVGADPTAAIELARQIHADERLVLEGIATHLPVAESDREFTAGQVADLAELRDSLAAEGIDVDYVHAANTAGALDHPDARFDFARDRTRDLRPAAGARYRAEVSNSYRRCGSSPPSRSCNGSRPERARRTDVFARCRAHRPWRPSRSATPTGSLAGSPSSAARC